MDVYGELLAQVAVSKDENGSKYAIKRLAELVKEGDVGRLYNACPKQTELFSLWDLGVTKNATPHYVENFCTIFHYLLDVDGEGVGERLLHPKRVRIIHSLLSSGNRTKISSGLLLLKHIAGGGSVNVNCILKNIDFSLNAIKVVGIPPKVSGGTMMNAADMGADGKYAYSLWTCGDLSKMPTRAAYIEFFKSMVVHCHPVKLAELLTIKHFMNGAINYLSKDPYYIQQDILQVIQRYVLDQNPYTLTPPTKGKVISDKFLSQLAQIVQQASERQGDNQDDVAQNVLYLATTMLSKLLSDPNYGIVSYDGIDVLFSKRLEDCQCQKAVSLLHAIKPAACKELCRLMHTVFGQNSVVAALYLRKVSIDIDPKKLTSCLINLSVMIMAFDALLSQIHSVGRQSSLDQGVVLQNWKILSKVEGISRTSLSKCLQHKVSLISHTTIVYMTRLLETLSAVLNHVQSCCGTDDYVTFRKTMATYATKGMPDVQIIIACHAKLVADHKSSCSCRSQKLSGVLHLLRIWITIFPEVLLESNISIEKIVPSDIHEMHPQNQREYIDMVQQASSCPRSVALHPVLGTMLKLYLHETNSDLYQTNLKWFMKQLQGTHLFYDGPMSCITWASTTLRQKSEFVIEFLVDSIKTTIKRPNIYLDLIHSCDFGQIGMGNVHPISISPLLACAIEKMCRIVKSKSRDISDKIKIAGFMKEMLVEYCSQSTHPLHVLVLFRHVVSLEFPAIAGNAQFSEGERYEELPARQFFETLENSSAFTWIVDFQEKGSQLVGTRPDIPAKKKQKMQQHDGTISMKPSEKDSILWYLFYDEKIVRLQNKQLKFWTSAKHVETHELLGLLEEDLTRAVLTMQCQFLHGRSEIVSHKIITFLSALEELASKSNHHAQMAFETLSGSNSTFFWERIRERLEIHLDLTIGLYKVIKVFENKPVTGWDCLCKQIQGGSFRLWADDLRETIQENMTIIVAQVMCQSSLKLEIKDLKILLEICIASTGQSTTGEVSVQDIICNLVSLNLANLGFEDQLKIFDFLDGMISNTFVGKYPIEGYMRYVQVYCSLLHTSQSTALQSVPRSLIDTLFSNISSPGVPDCLAALCRLEELDSMISYLIKALNNAKTEESKYSRRKLLASILPVLDACLSQNPSERALDSICNAFVEPLMQYFTSKRIKFDTNPEDVDVFKALPRYSLSILQRLMSSASVESIMEYTEPLLHMKPGIEYGSSNEYHNPDLLNKLCLVKDIARHVAATKGDNHGKEHYSIFLCKISTFAMNFFSSIIGSTHQRSDILTTLMRILDILGDSIANFYQEDRGNEHYFQMVQVWATRFAPCILKTCNGEVELSRCLRRFTASLVPEDEDENILHTGNSTQALDLYRSSCSLFLGIVTADSILEALKTNTSFGSYKKEYIKSTLPLQSIVGCVHSGAMMWNGLKKTDNPKALQKIEICELLESLLDIIDHFECIVSQHRIERYEQNFESAESALLRYLLASYDASLCQSDLAAWSLIKVLNKRIWRRKTNNYDEREGHDDKKESIRALLSGPLSEMKFAWGMAALSQETLPPFQVQPLRCAMTVVDYPEWIHAISEDRLPDNVAENEIPAEHYMSYEPSGYDPSFIVPACLSLLQSGDVTGEYLIDTLVLSVIIRCLGSSDVFLRAMALECLWLLDQQTSPILEAPSRDIQRLRLILEWIRNSMTSPFQRISSIHAVFAAEMSMVMFRPASDLYPLFSKYLADHAFLDCTKIPFLKAGMSSADGNQRLWFQKLLITGIRNGRDVFLYSKSHIFEVAMSLATSRHNHHTILAIMLLQKAASIPKGARVMAESCGLMSWLAIAILLQKDAPTNEYALSHLQHAWKLMSSWKGTLQRGSDRDRINASRELKVAENRLTSCNQVRTCILANQH